VTWAGTAKLLRILPEPYLLVRPTGEVITANAAAAKLLRLEPETFRTVNLTSLTTDPPQDILEYLAGCAGSGSSLSGALTLRNGGGSPRRVRCRGSRLHEDDTERVADAVLLRLDPGPGFLRRFRALSRTVAALKKEARDRGEAARALRRSEARMAFLAEASAVLAASLDYGETLRNVARLAVPRLADWCAVDVIEPGGELVRVAVEHSDPQKVALAYELQRRYPADPDAPHGVAQVVRTGESEFVAEIPQQLLVRAARDEEHLRLIRSLGLRSYIAVPLKTRHATLGAITFAQAESGRVYTEADRRLLDDLGRRCANAIETARLVRDLEDARDQIQQQALVLERQVEEARELNAALAATNDRLEQVNLAEEVARREAEGANAAKSQFLAAMSHELRTPLNAIMGYADLLEAEVAGPLNQGQKQQLERIRSGANRLLDLIDQVLSLTRIEAGGKKAELAGTDAAELAREVAASVAPLAERKGLRMIVRLPDRPEPVRTDPGMVRQILFNLLSNAVKFTERGSIRLSLERVAAELLFRVEDTGIGLAPGDLERVFVAFEQLDRDLRSRVDGAGLGLSVSRELARLLGGDVVVESQLGVGSTFTLRLPAGGADPT
jgi:signal transduction histidine kinase